MTVCVVYAATLSHDENEVEAFYTNLERFYREDYAFFDAIFGDFNANIGVRRMSQEQHTETNGLE